MAGIGPLLIETDFILPIFITIHGGDVKAPAKSFEDLIVWQRAHTFVTSIYRTTSRFPRTEVYGLTSQFRRAGISIPANIAEGFRTQTRIDKARFLNIAEASLEECRYYIILSHDLGYLDKADLWQTSDEVGRLLNAYRAAILKNTPDNSKS